MYVYMYIYIYIAACLMMITAVPGPKITYALNQIMWVL